MVKFLQIADAMKFLSKKVDICGLAVESSIPKTTQGTDDFCVVRIIDESQPSGIPVHFFTEIMEALPLIRSVGDIVCISRVTIELKRLDDNDYVFAFFDKRFSAFALFEGRGRGSGRGSSVKELVPYAHSSLYRPTYKGMDFIMGLKSWSYGDKIEVMHQTQSLHEIRVDQHLNLLCKILHIVKVPGPGPGPEYEWMIFLWDGTDAPPASVQAQLEDEGENPLPLALEPSSLLARDIINTFPIVGTVLRMNVDEGKKKLGINLLEVNKWVKFINIQCETQAALWRAVLTPSSRLYYLPDDDNIAKQHERSYKERVESKWGRNDARPSDITEIGRPDVPFVTLMTVLTEPEVPHKFSCVVRVVALFPWRPEDFRSPDGIYRLRLTLEDPTARIHAYLYGADWVTFFGDCHSIDVLTKKRNMLLGVDPALTERNPPWIKCCLKSYYIEGHDTLGTKNYRICETTCID